MRIGLEYFFAREWSPSKSALVDHSDRHWSDFQLNALPALQSIPMLPLQDQTRQTLKQMRQAIANHVLQKQNSRAFPANPNATIFCCLTDSDTVLQRVYLSTRNNHPDDSTALPRPIN